MFKMSVQDAAWVAGCCFRCGLRFAGTRGDSDTNLYKVKSSEFNNGSSPNAKRSKDDLCVCCVGLLQPAAWSSMIDALEEEVKINSYDCDYYALGLSLPTSIILREHSMTIYLKQMFPDWVPESRIPFKVAWKWTISETISNIINKSLDSGAVCQFLITFHMNYDYDLEDLESLKKMLPSVFAERKKSHRKYHSQDYSRAGIEKMLSKVDSTLFLEHYSSPPLVPKQNICCSKVESCHNSIYLGGRYIKYSRDLSQTPWILDGKRKVDNSIQDIIFKPIVEFYKIPESDAANRLKFISSGREDVDVRCLGEGRPFAVEILNPMITKFNKEQLNSLMASMNDNGNLLKINSLQLILREDLSILKEGEEKKTKTYEALCIKLSNNIKNCSKSECELGVNLSPKYIVTEDEINILNTYCDSSSLTIKQKTPLRVLHRRPLLTRDRKIYKMSAKLVEGESNLFIVEMTTQAGTYIKEFVHGDFGRTNPSFFEILGFKADILALDVTAINLDWPKKNN